MSDKAIKYLLEKLSTKFGIIDFKQPIQTSFLFSLMQDLEVPVHLIQETISNLAEDDKEKKKKAKIAKQKGLKSTGWNNYEDSAGNNFTWSDERQDIIPIGDKSDDTEEKPDTDTKQTGTPPPKKPKITDIPDNPMVKSGKNKEDKKLKLGNTSEEQRKIDHDTTDSQLKLTVAEAKAQAKQKGEKGVGAGTPESRAGEAATHYALRRIKEGATADVIKTELLKIAKGKLNPKTGKLEKTVLTTGWVNGALNCSEYIVNKYGINNIEEIVWDTPNGRELIDTEGHDTSADMFIKLTDGTRIGISLKKDGKVFILNGGYDKQFEKLLDGLDLPEEKINQLTDELGYQTFKDDREIAFSEGVNNLIGALPTIREELNNYQNDSKLAEKHFGPNYQTYLDVLNQSDEVYFQLIQKAKEQSLSIDEMKALSKIAKSNKRIREMLPDVYGEMRGSEIRLTQNILKKANEDPEFREGLKEIALEGMHVEEILGIHDNPKLDKFITVYGEKNGAELSPETLVKLFNLDVLYNELKDSEDDSKQNKLDEIRAQIRGMVEFDFKDGARDGTVKIKHEGPPEQNFPLFTIKCRTKPIGDAPTLEMAQTTFMGNALKHGLDINEWPETNRKSFYTGQLKELYEQLEDSAGDEAKDVETQINEMERKTGYQRVFVPNKKDPAKGKYVYVKIPADEL